MALKYFVSVAVVLQTELVHAEVVVGDLYNIFKPALYTIDLDMPTDSWSLKELGKYTFDDSGTLGEFGVAHGAIFAPMQKGSSISWHRFSRDGAHTFAGNTTVNGSLAFMSLPFAPTSCAGGGLVGVVEQRRGDVTEWSIGLFPLTADGVVGAFERRATTSVVLKGGGMWSTGMLNYPSVAEDECRFSFMFKNEYPTFDGAIWLVDLVSGEVERTPWMPQLRFLQQPTFVVPGVWNGHGSKLLALNASGALPGIPETVVVLDMSNLTSVLEAPEVYCGLPSDAGSLAVMVNDVRYVYAEGKLFAMGQDWDGYQVFLSIDLSPPKSPSEQCAFRANIGHTLLNDQSRGSIGWLPPQPMVAASVIV